MDSDQEHEDQNHEERETPLVQEGENLNEANFIKKKLLEFQKFWPSRFDSQSIESIHGLDRNSHSSIVRIQLGDWKDMSHTWLLDLENTDLCKDTYWKNDKLISLSKFPYFPSVDKKVLFPKRLAVNFPSTKEDHYFSATYFAKSNQKVTVPSLIFGVDSMKIPISDNPLFEYWGRQSTLECQITNEILLLESDITNTISDLLDRLDISEHNAETIVEIKESLGLLHDANKLARASNFRAKSFSITSSCKAKLNMRDALLSKVKGEDYIKNALRGSCFMDDELFGPIPKDVQSKIDSFSNRSDSKLTQKPYNKRSSDSLPRRGNSKRRGSVAKFNSQQSNYNSNYNSGYNYDYDYPSTSNANHNPSQVSHSSSLFQEKPRSKNARGKAHRGRGKGSRH